MTETPDDGWLSTESLCTWLDVTRDWIYDHLNELPHVKIGRLLRFNKQEVITWLEKQRQVSL